MHSRNLLDYLYPLCWPCNSTSLAGSVSVRLLPFVWRRPHLLLPSLSGCSRCPPWPHLCTSPDPWAVIWLITQPQAELYAFLLLPCKGQLHPPPIPHPFLKSLYWSWALFQPCKLPHYFFLIKLQHSDCSQISNSSYLYHFLYEFVYGNFWETPNRTDFAEKVWELPQLYQQFLFVCWHLGRAPFALVVLIMRCLLATLAGTICLPTLSTISSLDCGLSSSSPLIPGLNLSSVFPPCWKKWFRSLCQVDPVSY